MKINQVYSAFGPLGAAFKKRIGIPPYRNPDIPVLFFGCYGNQIEKALKNNCFVVIVWRGSDIVGFKENKDWVNSVRGRENIKHVAISNFIEDDLKELGFPYKSIPITSHVINDVPLHPPGESIYLYKDGVYGKDIIPTVKDRLSDFNFIMCNHKTHDRRGIMHVYKECFIGIRAIDHDGLSNTAIELGLMGRPIIWNGNTPNAIRYTDAEDIVAKVKEAYSVRKEHDYAELSEKMKLFLECEDFLDTDIWNK